MALHRFMRVAAGCSPADGRAWAAVKRFNEGEEFLADIPDPRSQPQLRLWWALMDKAFENLPEGLQSEYGDRHGLSDAVLCRLGYCRELRRESPDGTVTIIQQPKSIARSRMGQEEFNGLFDKANELLAQTLGIDADTLRGEAADHPAETPSERNLRGI